MLFSIHASFKGVGTDYNTDNHLITDSSIITKCWYPKEDVYGNCFYNINTKDVEFKKDWPVELPLFFNERYVVYKDKIFDTKTKQETLVNLQYPKRFIDSDKIIFPSGNNLKVYDISNDIQYDYAISPKSFNLANAEEIDKDVYLLEDKIFDYNQEKIFQLGGADNAKIRNTVFSSKNKIFFQIYAENPNSLKFPNYANIFMATLHYKFIEKDVQSKEKIITKTLEPIKINISQEKVNIPEITRTNNEILGCTKDSQCEVGLCNIETGYCVECYKGKCLCQESYKSCLNNTKCVRVKAKNPGEYYDCEFECESGIGKNGQCINPITISFSASKKKVNVGEGTDITISFDNALDNDVEADLTVTSGNGVDISSSEACQSGTRNLCKSFHKIGPKEVKQVSIRVDCVDALDKIPVNGKITYTAKDFRTTTEERIELNCIKKNIVQKIGFFDGLFRFLRGIFR